MRTATTQRSSREFEELAPYLKAVRDFPPLTREDEHALALRAQSGTVAQPDLSLDSAIDEEGDVTHLERIEDDGPGPEDSYLSAEGDREVRDALGKVRKRIGELGWDIVHNRLQQDSP